jgi:hypothetical protein
VKEIRFCPVKSVTHVKASVMASMRNVSYLISLTIENETSLVLTAKCQCVAGAAGKCNHVAAVLFALVEYKGDMLNRSCTDEPQKWHLPSRKSKQSSKPVKTGMYDNFNYYFILIFIVSFHGQKIAIHAPTIVGVWVMIPEPPTS